MWGVTNNEEWIAIHFSELDGIMAHLQKLITIQNKQKQWVKAMERISLYYHFVYIMQCCLQKYNR